MRKTNVKGAPSGGHSSLTLHVPGQLDASCHSSFAGNGSDRIKIKALWAAAALVSGATSPTASASVPNFLVGSLDQVAVISREQERIPFSGKAALSELRRRTALTWDQIAQLMEVSRRTVHSWASGNAMRGTHKARLEALLDRVSALKAMRSFQIRQLLLDEAGLSPTSPAAKFEEPLPAILVSSDKPLESGVTINKEAKTKIRRS